jgi:hypothetical protein
MAGESTEIFPTGRGRLECAVTALTLAAALLFLDDQLGPFPFTLRRPTAVTVLVLLAAFRWSREKTVAKVERVGCSGAVPPPHGAIRRFSADWNSRLSTAGWLAVVAALAVVARAPSAPIALVGFIVALAAIEIKAGPPSCGDRPASWLVPACLSYVAISFAVDLVPQIGAIPDLIARAGSRYISSVRGTEVHLSFAALGGPSVLVGVLYLLWSYRARGCFGRLAAVASLPLMWFALLAAVTPDVSAGPLAAFWRGSLHGLFWLGLAAVVSAVLPGRRTIQGDEGRPGSDRASLSGIFGMRSRRRLSLAAAGLAAALAGVCLVGTALLGPAAGRTVLVHNRGGLDWDRPVFGRFGGFSGGMFGLLPVYCRAEGYNFDVIDKDNIESVDLERTQILMLINSPKIWDERERRTILDFMARGGSLLVLGDHTDVFGLMRGFNSLLGPLGIQFRFDSAYKARDTWRGCQAAAPDAIAWGWDEENPGVAVGASLELSGSARPLLIGRYGFSDDGVHENTMGSFLGNYHYDKGERLGDMVLIATTTYGRGRVVVWGDTSAFQSPSPYYPDVVGPMLAWLSRPAAWTERPPFRIVATLGLLAAILWLWFVRATVAEAAIVGVGLLLGLLIPWLLSLPRTDSHILIADDTVLIDRSHLPASGHYEARVNPVGPLYTNLLRSGFRVADMKDWDSTAIARARAIAFVAPQRSFTHSEVDDLLKAEDSGAVVLLNTGEPDSAGSRGILKAHGLAIAPRPMGTVTSADTGASRRERERQPRFLDAWPIAAVDGEGDPAALPGVEVIYRHGEDVVALFRRMGKGGLLLVSDTRFFSDMNVEDMSGFWPGNLALIHDLFWRYLGADPDSVKPLFRSPDKPQ